MTKKALWGGRLIAVMALASAFLGSTARAGDLPPAPTVPLKDCKDVAVVRDATHTSKLTVRGETQTATATVHGDATVRVCWDLEATAGAAVSVAVESAAEAQATAEAVAAGVVADSEEVCVNARASLVAAAGTSAHAKGTVTAAVVANTSASADTNTVDADAQGTAAILLTAFVDVSAGSPTSIDEGELAAYEGCTETTGLIG